MLSDDSASSCSFRWSETTGHPAGETCRHSCENPREKLLVLNCIGANVVRVRSLGWISFFYGLKSRTHFEVFESCPFGRFAFRHFFLQLILSVALLVDGHAVLLIGVVVILPIELRGIFFDTA